MKILKTLEQKQREIENRTTFAVEVECEEQLYWKNVGCGALLEIEEGDIQWYEYDHGPYCNGERDTGRLYYANCGHCGAKIALFDTGDHGVRAVIPTWLAMKIHALKPTTKL